MYFTKLYLFSKLNIILKHSIEPFLLPYSQSYEIFLSEKCPWVHVSGNAIEWIIPYKQNFPFAPNLMRTRIIEINIHDVFSQKAYSLVHYG